MKLRMEFKMYRVWAIVERELRRVRRSPLLIIITIIGPLLQLVILGYAFGGNLHGLRLALVDQDHGIPALKIHELTNTIAANARTFETIDYHEEAQAITDLRRGKVDGVLTIPPGYSRRLLAKNNPSVGFIENNSDRFVSTALSGTLQNLITATSSSQVGTIRLNSAPRLDIVELFPFVPYIQYLLAGTIVLAIYTMAMLGGVFSFSNDKTLGIHEGYLVTPITKLEMVTGFTISGAVKAVIAGIVLMIVGMLIAGIDNVFEPIRLLKLSAVVVLTSLAFVNMLFMLLARVDDPMIPRIASQLLTTLLFFPSGAVYPIQAFPSWLRVIATVNPFTYAVHALRSILIQNVSLSAITLDLTVLAIFTVLTMGISAVSFKRTL